MNREIGVFLDPLHDLICGRAFDGPLPARPADMRSQTAPRAYFTAVIIFYCLFMLACQSEWVLSGEMFGDMGNNYYVVAAGELKKSLLFRMFATDGGYIPLPLRLMGLFGFYADLKAAAIPYYYTWTGIVGMAMMVGVFCLAPFRALIPSDLLRFLVCLLLLVVVDFESRVVLNVPYFGLFFCGILIALAMTPNAPDAPGWAWAAPILIVSKAHDLILLPLLVWALFLAKPRFRWVIAACLVASAGQLVHVASHALGGTRSYYQSQSLTFFEKIYSTLAHFFGLLSGYAIGPRYYGHVYDVSVWLVIGLGLVAFALLVLLLLRHRHPAASLIVVGAALLLLTCLINSFALSVTWNPTLVVLPGIPVYRHILSGYFGAVLILVALIQIGTDRWPSMGRRLGVSAQQAPFVVAPVLFLGWLALSGWIGRGLTMSEEPPFPLVGASAWQKYAAAIDSGRAPLCVPINPYTWIYARRCRTLVPLPEWDWAQRETFFGRLVPANQPIRVAAPAEVTRAAVTLIGIPLRPAGAVRKDVRVHASAELLDGSTVTLSGNRVLEPSGGLVTLDIDSGVAELRNVRSLVITSDAPVSVLQHKAPNDAPIVSWMGY